MRTLWCTKCAVGYASVAGDLPKVCPRCDQETVWTTLAPQSARSYDWVLNVNDKRFLRSLRIEAV